jgi:thymidylate kinase
VPATRPRPLLIAAEGPDGSGKTAGLERLARWLERRDRRVSVVPWVASPRVRAAASSPRTRVALTPRVASLLGAADDAARAMVEVRPRLTAGRVVLLDRYAWTAVARETARGLDPAWAGALHAPLPAPDLVLLFRQDPGVVLARALAGRPPSADADPIATAFGAFLERLVDAYDGLVAASGTARATPWPVPVLVVDARLGPELTERLVREAVRPLLDGDGLPPGALLRVGAAA